MEEEDGAIKELADSVITVLWVNQMFSSVVTIVALHLFRDKDTVSRKLTFRADH